MSLPRHKTIDVPTQFESERLVFCRPELANAKSLNEAIVESFDVLSQWMAWATHIPGVEETLSRVSLSHDKFNNREEFQFHLLDKATGLVAGSCGLHYWNDERQSFEMGYWIRKRFHQQGYATEAARALTQWVFELGLVDQLEIHVAADNLVSQRVALACGYQHEWTERGAMKIIPDDLPVDELVFVQRNP